MCSYEGTRWISKQSFQRVLYKKFLTYLNSITYSIFLVQITIETTAFPLQALPFPAVTVCSPTYDKMGFTQK
jgi:hypothetical protein